MRLYVDPTSVRGHEMVITDRKRIHYMHRVMRLRTGDTFIAINGSGKEYCTKITSLDERSITGNILETQDNKNEPRVFVTLYQALPKKIGLLEMILQKCTELGVSRFVPIITARTERQELRNIDRLKAIIIEAVEQSERGKIPELSPILELTKALEMDKSETRLIAHSRLQQTTPTASKAATVSICVGPEGGFTEEEIEKARTCGVTTISLGPRILRTETAAIALAARVLE